MWRFIGFLSLLFIVIVSPQSQAVLLRGAEIASTPYYRWTAKKRIEEIAQGLQRYGAEGRRFPTNLDFAPYLRRTDGEKGVTDPWGTPYFLVTPVGFHVRVGSAGQDRTVGTEDDMLSGLIRTPDHPAYLDGSSAQDTLAREPAP